MLLVPRIEVLIAGKHPSVRCSFPNDTTTGAVITYYDVRTDLEDDRSLKNVLSEPIQLQAGEMQGLRVGFKGMYGYCYTVQIRAYWKRVGCDSGEAILSDPYLLQFPLTMTTWQQEVSNAIQLGETLVVRIASGWRTFDKYVSSASGSIVVRNKLPYDSNLQEFIVLGQRAVIFPVLPPRDRYVESHSLDRDGVLLTSANLAKRCVEANAANGPLTDWF
jgi:hypothetical protein